MATPTATAAIEKEMLALENEYWTAIKEKDVEAALRATTDPCVVAGASGVASVDGKLYAEMMKGGNWELKGFKLDDVIVQPVSDDVRIVAYKVREELIVDGKPLSMDAADTSVWVRKSGTWMCALHTESVLGDAYGRDRMPAK